MADVDEPITIVDPDPRWPALFAAEAARVRAALGEVALSVEHVGSTAVPLAGKPIVDLLVAVPTLDAARAATPRLVALGYEDFGEIFLPGRLYLRRRSVDHFNVALAEERSVFYQTQLAVRDYLRAHPDEADAYAAEKRAAYANGAHLFSTYSHHKNAFVTNLIERAQAWSRL